MNSIARVLQVGRLLFNYNALRVLPLVLRMFLGEKKKDSYVLNCQ